MRVGVARQDITPAVGTYMSGYAGRGASESVLDPLEVQALAWTDAAGVSVVIIAADLLGFDYDFTHAAREAIAKVCPVSYDGILLNCSHTHGGPTLLNNLVTEAPTIDPAYRARVFDAVVTTTQAAFAAQEAVTAAAAFGTCTIGINRRSPEPPYGMSPNPRGFYDDTVGVVAFFRVGTTEPAAVLFNATCHPTTLGSQPCFSAEWPGAARRSLIDYFGVEAVFVQGACGNIRPRTYDLANPGRFRQGTPAEFTRMGHACAQEVIRLVQDELWELPDQLWVGRQTCDLPLDQQPTTADLERLAAGSERVPAAFAKVILEQYPKGLPATLPYEVQLIMVADDLAIIAQPGEVVSELGAAAKDTIDQPALFCGYSNGLPCYVPSAQIRRQGGYEAGGSNLFFGLPGWLRQDSELVMLGALEDLWRRRGT